MALDADQIHEACRRIAAWRADPNAPLACPACEEVGLAVIDRSARPYAEWYALACSACGLTETLNIPLGVSAPGLD